MYMTKKRKVLCALIGVGLVVWAVIAIPRTKQYVAWKEERDKEREKERVAAEKAYFQERVEGFMPADWREGSWVQIERGGWNLHTFCKWTSTGSRYKSEMDRRAEPSRFVWSEAVALSPTGDHAIEDALNIIVRDKLWVQQDIIPAEMIPDMTGTTVEFQIGSHAGKFKFYDNIPRENVKLRQFIHKLRTWQADVEAALDASDRAHTNPAGG